MDPKTLSRYLQAIADDMEDIVPDYEQHHLLIP